MNLYFDQIYYFLVTIKRKNIKRSFLFWKKRGTKSYTELYIQLNPSLGACPVFFGKPPSTACPDFFSGWPAWFILSLSKGLVVWEALSVHFGQGSLLDWQKIWIFHFNFSVSIRFLILVKWLFIGAVVLSILAVAYFSLAGVLFAFSKGLTILSDVLITFTYCLIHFIQSIVRFWHWLFYFLIFVVNRNKSSFGFAKTAFCLIWLISNCNSFIEFEGAIFVNPFVGKIKYYVLFLFL